MTTFWKSAGIILLAAVSFAAGAIIAGLQHWFQPVVHVAIKNDSDEDLVKLVLTHESRGLISTVTLPALKRGQSTELSFFVAGEASYQVQAQFPDGRIVTNAAGYVETGSSIKEVIAKTKKL